MARSSKQHKASLNRIKLENKTNREASKLIAKQYEALGRKVPQKIQNNKASSKDFERYLTTLHNALDRRIIKSDSKLNTIENKLNEYNKMQDKRQKAVEGLLKGYNKELVGAYTQGKLISIGRDVSVSMADTKHITAERATRLAELNKVKDVRKFLEMRTKSLKRDLRHIKTIAKDDGKDITDNIKTIMETHGYNMSDENMRILNNRVGNLDFLGRHKLGIIINTKMESMFYDIYKKSLDMNDNDKLMESIINDINKSKKSKIDEYYRVIT